MIRFASAHATHPDWRSALSLALVQLQGSPWPASAPGAAPAGGAGPTLGFVYLSDHYAREAPALVGELQARWPQTQWVGTVGVGVSASGVEYFDEPALSLLLTDLPPSQWRVFSGRAPLAAGGPFQPAAALVHAEGRTPELAALVEDLSRRTSSGFLFGGLVASRGAGWQIGNGVFEGGLSGVAFGPDVPMISRVTQGCQPIGPTRRITAAREHVVLELDGEPAFDVLLADLGIRDETPAVLLPRLHGTLAGLTPAPESTATGDGAGPRSRPGPFGPDTLVRHLIGVDPRLRAVAVAHPVEPGVQLAFCRRDPQAARRDLVRICTELRDAVESGEAAGEGARIAGALYISCAGRGGPHFGAPSAELQIVQRALGEVPLAGFFAGGEIAHHHVLGYTGVLTVFLA